MLSGKHNGADGERLAEERTAVMREEIARLGGLLREPFLRRKRRRRNPVPKPPVYKEFPSPPAETRARDMAEWKARCARIAADNARMEREAWREYHEWHAREAEESKEAGGVPTLEAKAEEILRRLTGPVHFPRGARVCLEEGRMVVSLDLPGLEAMPAAQAERYIKTQRIFRKVPMAVEDRSDLYDAVVYSLAVRAVHVVAVELSLPGEMELILRGRVVQSDPATGKNVEMVVVTLGPVCASAVRDLDVTHVEPAACFRSLGGRGGPGIWMLRGVDSWQERKHD